MPLATLSAGDIAYIALAIFLVLVGLGLAYAFYWLGASFQRLSSLISGVEREALPVINKVGGSVDRVNGQLDKLDLVTDSAVDAAESADTAVRAVSFAITRPVQKISGFAAGISHGASSLKARKGFGEAMADAKDAAHRREEELAEELAETEEPKA
jgi:uncharacterized protein YoxC